MLNHRERFLNKTKLNFNISIFWFRYVKKNQQTRFNLDPRAYGQTENVLSIALKFQRDLNDFANV